MVRILSKQRCGLKIVHINAQSLQNKIDEFREIFINSGVDIICVSETWFRPVINDSAYNVSGYNMFRADRLTHAGGVCMYVRSHIKCEIKLISDKDSRVEFLFIELLTPCRSKVLIGCVYRPNRLVELEQLV